MAKQKGVKDADLNKVKDAIKKNMWWITDSLGKALHQEGWGVMQVSQRQVPVDMSLLRNSKVVLPPKIGADGVIEVVLGYGAPYAIYVHERVRSKKGRMIRHNPPTKAKYLSDPFQKAMEGYSDRLARRTAALWKRKKGVK